MIIWWILKHIYMILYWFYTLKSWSWSLLFLSLWLEILFIAILIFVLRLFMMVFFSMLVSFVIGRRGSMINLFLLLSRCWSTLITFAVLQYKTLILFFWLLFVMLLFMFLSFRLNTMQLNHVEKIKHYCDAYSWKIYSSKHNGWAIRVMRIHPINVG